jgi:hypothetical protein
VIILNQLHLLRYPRVKSGWRGMTSDNILAHKPSFTKISIILPTYSECRNIIRAIESIIDNISAEGSFELIVVDDNSPDIAANLVEE